MSSSGDFDASWRFPEARSRGRPELRDFTLSSSPLLSIFSSFNPLHQKAFAFQILQLKDSIPKSAHSGSPAMPRPGRGRNLDQPTLPRRTRAASAFGVKERMQCND